MLPCQLLIGGEAVIDKDEAFVVLLSVFLLINNGITASFLECALGEFVSVERRTFQRDEDTSLRAVAAVGGHLRMLQVKLI